MTTPFLVPLTAQPQTLTITLVGVDYKLTVRWNDVLYGGGLDTPCWFLDLADLNGVALLSGVPLVTGHDLLEQYGYLGIGGSLVAQSDADLDQVPPFDALGKTSNLYFLTG